MKIRYRKKNNPEFFEDINLGDVFGIQGDIFIKIDFNKKDYNSFNVNKNSLEFIEENQPIKIYNAELVFEDV